MNIISSNRLIIRDWINSDQEHIQYWYSGAHDWMKSDAPFFKKPSDEVLVKRIQYYHNLTQPENQPVVRQNLVIALNEKFIGNVNWYYTNQETEWISIGLSIFDPIHWHKGYGTEALAIWTTYLFDKMPALMRLDLYTWSGNIGMQNCAKKIGYQEEARFRNARVVNGKFYDAIGLGILRKEWEQQLETIQTKYRIHKFY